MLFKKDSALPPACNHLWITKEAVIIHQRNYLGKECKHCEERKLEIENIIREEYHNHLPSETLIGIFNHWITHRLKNIVFHEKENVFKWEWDTPPESIKVEKPKPRKLELVKNDNLQP